VDVSELKPGDYVIGGGALVFLISMFLPWFGLGDYTENGLDFFVTGFLPLLLIVAVVVLVAVQALTDADVPQLPIPWSLVYLIAAGIAALLVLLRIMVGADDPFGFGGSLDRKFGIFITFLAAGAVAAGAVIKLITEGDLDDLTGRGGGFGPPGGAPPQQPRPF
jgi:hypothetical protein